MTDNRAFSELNYVKKDVDHIKADIKNLSDTFSRLFIKIVEHNKKEIQILEEISNHLKKLTSLTSISSSQPTSGEHENLRSYMETLEVIKSYKKSELKGITAEKISEICGLSRPTVYNHLKELQKSNLVFIRNGSKLGLKPANANFYYPTEIDPAQTLYNFNFLTQLPNLAQKIARIIIENDDRFLTKQEIMYLLNDKHIDSNLSNDDVEHALQILLQSDLVNFEYKSGEKVFKPKR